jgi:hypothetical protein
LGADPQKLLPPKGKWPEDVFGWFVRLEYDQNGNLNVTGGLFHSWDTVKRPIAAGPPGGSQARKRRGIPAMSQTAGLGP